MSYASLMSEARRRYACLTGSDYDDTGSEGSDGTAHGDVTIVGGPFDDTYAYEFGGTDGYIEFAAGFTLLNTDDYTIAWEEKNDRRFGRTFGNSGGFPRMDKESDTEYRVKFTGGIEYAFTTPSQGTTAGAGWNSFALRNEGGVLTLFMNGVNCGSHTMNDSLILRRIGGSSTTYLAGRVYGFTLFDRALTDAEIRTVAAGPRGMRLFTPKEESTAQRDQHDLGNIGISGVYDQELLDGVGGGISAYWGSYDPQEIDANPEDGYFLGILRNQYAQWERMTVVAHLTEFDEVSAASEYVGVGDNIAVFGQSNHDFRGTNNNTSAYVADRAKRPSVYLKSNDYELITDPISRSASNTAAYSVQVDGSSGGSWFVPFADWYAAKYKVATTVVVNAVGNKSFADWQPHPVDPLSTTTLLGAFLTRCLAVGGIKHAYLWLGETDALLGTSLAICTSQLTTIVNTIKSVLGVKTFITDHYATTSDDTKVYAANAAVIALGNAIRNAVMSAITTGDNLHAVSDAEVLQASEMHRDAVAASGAVLAARLPGYTKYIEWDPPSAAWANKFYIFNLANVPADACAIIAGNNELRWSDEDNTILPHDPLLAPFAHNGTSLTGVHGIHSDVQVDSATRLRLWYNGDAAASAVDETLAYPSSYKGVWPNGGGTTGADRTSNNNDFTQVGGAFTSGGVDFANAGVTLGMGLKATDYVPSHRSDASAVAITAEKPVTLLSWFNADVVNINQSPLSSSTNGSANNYMMNWISSGGLSNFTHRDNDPATRTTSPGAAVSAGTDHLIIGTTDANNNRLVYLDGAQAGISSTISSASTGMNRLSIGGNAGTGTFYFDGKISLSIAMAKYVAAAEAADWYAMRDQATYYGSATLVDLPTAPSTEFGNPVSGSVHSPVNSVVFSPTDGPVGIGLF